MALGKVIVFEGIDGCGKSTQLCKLYDKLAESPYIVTHTKQPGGTRVGVELRRILKNKDTVIDNKTERLLFAADNMDFLNTLAKVRSVNDIILVDRFSGISERVYGLARASSDEDYVELLTTLRTLDKLYSPVFVDLVIFFRIDADAAADRRKDRNDACRFEADAEYLRAVAERYDSLFKNKVLSLPDYVTCGKIATIDACNDVNTIADEVYSLVKELLY